MKRVHFAKEYRIPVSEFRKDVATVLAHVGSGEAFVIQKRMTTLEGRREEDIAFLVSVHTSVEDFARLRDQLQAEADAAHDSEVDLEVEDTGDESGRLRSEVRAIDEERGAKQDTSRGRRRHG